MCVCVCYKCCLVYNKSELSGELGLKPSCNSVPRRRSVSGEERPVFHFTHHVGGERLLENLDVVSEEELVEFLSLQRCSLVCMMHCTATVMYFCLLGRREIKVINVLFIRPS